MLPAAASLPNSNTPYHSSEGTSHLASISPSTIFLHDGVLRSLQLSTLKEFEQQYWKFHDALTIPTADQMEELMAIGLSSTSPGQTSGGSASRKRQDGLNLSTEQLSRKILKLATLHVQSIGLHHRFQSYILERVWQYKNAQALQRFDDMSIEQPGGSVVDLDSGNNSLGFKLGLCLVVPMLEVYSDQNSSVALSAIKLLYSELANVPVMSLREDASHSIEKLEDLLARWANSRLESLKSTGPSAMVALCCARGVVSSFAKTILMLENLQQPLKSLPVANILRKLNNSRLKISKPCAILGDKFEASWPYDDRLLGDTFTSGKVLGTELPSCLQKLLSDVNEERGDMPTNGLPSTQANRTTATPTNTGNTTTANTSTSPLPEDIQKHFVATDGKFLFVTGPSGKGISKMGSGLRGSLQGWVYRHNLHLKVGFVAYANGMLISRPTEVDTLENAQNQEGGSKTVLGVILNKNTLKAEKLLVSHDNTEDQSTSASDARNSSIMCLAMTSDGSLLYLVKAEVPQSLPTASTAARDSVPAGQQTSDGLAPISVWVDIYEIIPQSCGTSYVSAVPKSLKVPLNYKGDEGSGLSDGNSRLTPVLFDELRQGPASARRTRSVRITPAPPLQVLTVGTPVATGTSTPDLNTTLGLSLRQLQNAFYFTCGNYLSIVVSNNVNLGAPGSYIGTGPITPGPITGPPTARQYTPVTSANVSRSTGWQIHICLPTPQTVKSPLPTGSFKQELTNLPAESSFYNGAIIPEMGATYDCVNNLVWTANGSLVDSWGNPGHTPPWMQDKLLILGNTTNDLISAEGPTSENADIKTVVSVMLRHVAIMANNFLSGDQEDTNIGFGLNVGSEGANLTPSMASVAFSVASRGNIADNPKDTPDGVLRTLLELMCKYRQASDGYELTALFLTLRAIVTQISRSLKTGQCLERDSRLRKELYNIQVMVLCLLSDENARAKLRDDSIVYQEACSLFAVTFDLLYTSTKARSEFFQELCQYMEDPPVFSDDDAVAVNGVLAKEQFETCKGLCSLQTSSPERLKLLEDNILQHFTTSLINHPAVRFNEGLKWVVDIPWLRKVIRQSIDGTKKTIHEVADAGFSDHTVIKITSNYPSASIATAYLTSVVDYFLRSLVLSSAKPVGKASSSTTVLLRDVSELGIEVFREILKAGPIITESVLEVIPGSPEPITYSVYSAAEAIMKSSLLGHGIPQILGYLSLETALRPVMDELTEECIQITVAMSFLANRMNPGKSKRGSSVDDIGEDWSSKVRVPSPWTSKRVFESPHPIRESFKMKDTIVIPGARQLYMKLSPQCATQYDYDRLSFISTYSPMPPPLTNSGSSSGAQISKKVFEFGGNYFGFGNRFFSGPGWGRQLIKLCEGSSIQYNFEMKSGREHSVPDKALWGYQFTVFPVMDYEDLMRPENDDNDDPTQTPKPLPTNAPGFATLTTLHSIDVIQNISRVLLEGNPMSPEEKANKAILENRLVIGLKWPKTLKDDVNYPRKFPSEMIAKVKQAVGIPPLQMRTSIIEKMRAPDLEELYFQCCMVHIGPNPFLGSETILTPVCESCWSSGPTREILHEIFQNIDTMFRRLMAFYEMEKMLLQEIEEISNYTKDISEAFFMDSSFMENSTDLQTLAWICYLDYDPDNPRNLISDVIAMCNALSSDPSSPPQLSRTEELIEETHLKCKYLLQATPISNMSFFGPVYPTVKILTERMQSIHGFISAHVYNPDATMTNFFLATRLRRERAGDRIKGLDILNKVLECSSPSSALLIVASLLLQTGPRLQSVLCSGLEKDVLKIYGEVMKTAVAIAEKNPLLHRYTIALLSITAYDRSDEENLVESGLVGVLDQLCAYQTGHLTPLYNRSSPTDTTNRDLGSDNSIESSLAHNKASGLAWAAFQVLASQCASWERPPGHHGQQQYQNAVASLLFHVMEDPMSSEWDEPEHRELPLQISINITNHLARAAALAALSSSVSSPEPVSASGACSPSLAIAIQDVLDLLNNLKTYKIGIAILKQSPCICRLLGLLQDSRLSPRLVLTILKLLRTSLPLVDDLDTADFKQIVPFSRNQGNQNSQGFNQNGSKGPAAMSSFWSVIESTPYTQVASMLLSKLADYLVCGPSSSQTSSKLPPEGSKNKHTCNTTTPNPPLPVHESPAQVQGLIDPDKHERMEVWLHKYQGANTGTDNHQATTVSIIRQLFMDTTRPDLKPTRGTLTELENEFNNHGKVLLYTDEAVAAEFKAYRISMLGHLVTLLPSGWSRTATLYNTVPTGGGGASNASPGNGTDLLCKEKNTYLANWDPARPFLSGHVAENLSSEIVQLVRALLNSSSTSLSTVLRGRSQSASALSTNSSRSNVVHPSASSTASVTTTDQETPSTANVSVLCSGLGRDSKTSDVSNGVISTKASPTSSSWPHAVEQIICAAMKLLPKLCQMPGNPTGVHLETYVYSARLVIAALAVLGGFTETIRSGLEVWIIDEPKGGISEDASPEDQWEFKTTRARVVSVSDLSPNAKVELLLPASDQKKGSDSSKLRVSETLTVPLTRLVPAHFNKNGQPTLPKLSRNSQTELAGFFRTLLVSTQSNNAIPGSSKGGPATSSKEFHLKRDLPTLNQVVTSINPLLANGAGTGIAMNAAQTQAESRQIAQAMTIVRLLAEIRTKSMQVLALWLRRSEFRKIFLGMDTSEGTINTAKSLTPEVQECTENLKELSKSCIPSHKTNSLEVQVAWLRLLYRDCTKPPRLPISEIDKPANGEEVIMRWDLSRQTPKIKCTIFSALSNGLVYTGDYNVSGGNPRGLVLYGNGPIPTNGFYWESTIVSMEEFGLHADLIVVPPLSIGYSPLPPNTNTNNDMWKYSSGTVMYTTLGRVVHYKTQDAGSWVSIRLDDDLFRVKAGDTIGVGWERQSNLSDTLTVTAGATFPASSQRYSARGRGMARNAGRLNAALVGFGRQATAGALGLSADRNGAAGTSVGVVYFTLNGRRLSSTVEQNNVNLYPIIHVQKKLMVVSTNLGERPFLYAEANKVVVKPEKTVARGLGGVASLGELAQVHQNTTETATSNADVLLRRVSDSLQDLSMVFNMNIHDFDSEPEINVVSQRSVTNSSTSGNSTQARRGDVEQVEDEAELQAEDDEWTMHEVDDEDPFMMDDEDDNDDEDSDDATEAVSEPNMARAMSPDVIAEDGFRVLPPSPASGLSASGSSISVRRLNTPAPPPPPPLPPPAMPRQRARSGGAKKKKGKKREESASGFSAGSRQRKKNTVTTKPPLKHIEYNPLHSLQYFLGHSPTTSVKVFQGPRRYMCPCAAHTPTPLDYLLIQPPTHSGDDTERRTADVDSIDGFEDDDGEDDIHTQLVKAWEQQVFPVIRRRFRNDTERRDGLEQIRGALQLGMWDIARQTVEFLYEEGGMLPRDLHFPTLEEVRVEQARCTMDKVKPGMNVTIRPFAQQPQSAPENSNSDVSMLPPPYAVATMLRTFGLTGEVLEVDVAHDLVLVETYMESEGVLVRFWYPVTCLDKGLSNKKPMLSTNTVNMFKLHSNLIAMEGSLCHLYSRQSYLSLAHHLHKSASLSSTSEHSPPEQPNKARDNSLMDNFSKGFDLDSIQILSDNLLANYPPSRDLFTYNLQCESPPLKFLSDPSNPSVLFYQRGDYDSLSNQIRLKIRTAVAENSLDELTSHMLSCMEHHEKFPQYELALDKIHDLEVHSPNSAFTLVSFKGPLTMTAKQMNAIDNTIHPCVHVFCFESSEINRHCCCCYPLEPLHVVMHRASSSSGEDGVPSIFTHTQTTTAGAADSSAAAAINKTMRKRLSRFPPILCPTDRVYCSISETSLPEVHAEIQGIPKDFPLALLYLQELIKASDIINFDNITSAVSRVVDFIDQIPLSPVIKDWIFTLLADLMRIRSKELDISWKPGVSEKVAKSNTPNRLFLELLLFRERESAELSLPTHTVPLINSLSEAVENRHALTLNLPPKPSKSVPPATLMFHISSFISAHQKSKKSMTDPNFSYYFNALNDLCLTLNEVSELIVNPYEVIPSLEEQAQNETSSSGSPKSGVSPTESVASGPHASAPPSMQVVPFTAVTKRPYVKAIRRKPTQSSTRDGFRILKEQKRLLSSGSAGTSNAALGGATSPTNQSKTNQSDDGFLVFAKASEIEWFNNQVVITRVLKDIVWHSPNDHNAIEASQVLIGTVIDKLKSLSVHNRLLIIHGAPVNIDGMSIEASLIRALRGSGGVQGNELWISENSAVVEISCTAKINEAFETLRQNYVWYPLEDYVLYPNVNVYRVNDNFKVIPPSPTYAAASATSSSSSTSPGQEGDKILAKFLRSKLLATDGSGKLNPKAKEALTSIFMSCYMTSIPYVFEPTLSQSEEGDSPPIPPQIALLLNREQMNLKLPGNLLDTFMEAIKVSPEMLDPEKDALEKFGEKMKPVSLVLNTCSPDEGEASAPGAPGCSENQSVKPEDHLDNSLQGAGGSASAVQDEMGLSLQGYLEWCTELVKTWPYLLWKGLIATGYDLHLERVWLAEDPRDIYEFFQSPDKWSLEKDAALVSYMDHFSQTLHIDPTRIQPPELALTESDYLNPAFTALQGVPTGHLRVRWGMLQKMNTLIAKKLLAHGSLHSVRSSQMSLANLLHDSRQLLLYYTKDAYLSKIILVSASRGSDTPTPELTLDPVSSIGSQDEAAFRSQLSQVIQQMATISTAFYCVPPAQGADPALPVSVKFQGEEVLGLSGSFRHFLLNAAKELQSEAVKLLARCPSADAGRNKDSFIITPGKVSYGEEDFLHFLGQLIGISIRSDAPLALPLLRAAWRSLLLSEKEVNDSSDDLVEADILCATYLRKLESLGTKASFDNFLTLNAWPKFQYPSMDSSSVVPLCVDGQNIGVSFANRELFIKLIKQLREKEIRSANKVAKILTGLSTIVPLPVILNLFTSDHLELRVAGSPDVNLSLLKSHTHYQVGVNENDPHIMYFWAALESFSPEELRKFIKFSANLERLPATCPCQSSEHFHHNSQENSSTSAVHVPPFPMKIAPIDIPPGATSDEIDHRLIRVETCLFLIRLPPYSSLQVTRQQLLFAINCREDPLSG